MAREPWTSQDLREIADRAEEIAKKIRKIAEKVDKEKMPHLLLHGANVRNQAIPVTLHWANKLETEYLEQFNAFQRGIPSRAEVMKYRSEIYQEEAKPPEKPKRKPKKK